MKVNQIVWFYYTLSFTQIIKINIEGDELCIHLKSK